MMYWLSRLIFALSGWKIRNPLPAGVDKFVLIVAPHTSLWDFVLGRLGLFIYRIPSRFLIKKDYFRFPQGALLKMSGGVPVDTVRGGGVAKSVLSLLNRRKKLCLVITPEGTRKKVKYWKKGFYFFSIEAGIPIVLGYMDYKEKVCCLGPVLYPSGNFSDDMKIIRAFYKGKNGRHPERFMLPEIPQNRTAINCSPSGKTQ